MGEVSLEEHLLAQRRPKDFCDFVFEISMGAKESWVAFSMWCTDLLGGFPKGHPCKGPFENPPWWLCVFFGVPFLGLVSRKFKGHHPY